MDGNTIDEFKHLSKLMEIVIKQRNDLFAGKGINEFTPLSAALLFFKLMKIVFKQRNDLLTGKCIKKISDK